MCSETADFDNLGLIGAENRELGECGKATNAKTWDCEGTTSCCMPCTASFSFSSPCITWERWFLDEMVYQTAQKVSGRESAYTADPSITYPINARLQPHAQ